MSAENPPLYLQAGTYPAQLDRRLIEKMFQDVGGVLSPSDLAVTERSAGANMSVDISGGSAVVKGSQSATQGSYFCHSTTVVNVALNASDPTNGRYDLIVASVSDDAFTASGTDTWALDVVEGTPAATPLYPAVPEDTIVLATVLVGASVGSIVDANITDVRFTEVTDGTSTVGNEGFAASHMARQLVSSAYKPSLPFRGQSIRHIADGTRENYNGSSWVKESNHFSDLTLTYGGGVTAWTGTVRYSIADNLCTVVFQLTAATIGTSFITFSGLPAAHSSYVSKLGTSLVHASDTSANVGDVGVVRFDTATTISIRGRSTPNTGWTHLVPFTWAVGDPLAGTITYEIA